MDKLPAPPQPITSSPSSPPNTIGVYTHAAPPLCKQVWRAASHQLSADHDGVKISFKRSSALYINASVPSFRWNLRAGVCAPHLSMLKTQLEGKRRRRSQDLQPTQTQLCVWGAATQRGHQKFSSMLGRLEGWSSGKRLRNTHATACPPDPVPWRHPASPSRRYLTFLTPHRCTVDSEAEFRKKWSRPS